jgi:hypothetical protein
MNEVLEVIKEYIYSNAKEFPANEPQDEYEWFKEEFLCL